MDFLTLVAILLSLSIPSILYYLFWAVKATHAKRNEKKEVLKNIKKAYFFNGILVFVIPLLLYRFLEEHLLFQYPLTSSMTLKFLLLVAVIFEIINIFSFEYFDKRMLIKEIDKRQEI